MTAAVWDIARQVREVGGRVHRAWSEVHPVAETCGHYACIWPAGRRLVLKLTFDPTDVQILALATRKRWPGFARVRYAFSMGSRFPGYWPHSPPVVSPIPLYGALITRYDIFDDYLVESALAEALSWGARVRAITPELLFQRAGRIEATASNKRMVAPAMRGLRK